MGTEIYTIDSRELKPWHELMPNKMKKVLESPGPHDRLLVCMEEDICGVNHDEQELFFSISGVEYTSSYDFDPEDYDELSLREPGKFFETHAGSVYCYDIPELAITNRVTFAFYNKVAKALAVLQVTNRHFLVCVSQEFGARTMFFTNCSAAVSTPINETAQPASVQPEPLKWLTDEQDEILALRVELLRRDFWDWCDNESLDRPDELFGNFEKFITMCHNGTLLDSASTVDGYILLETLRQAVVSLQGFGYLCNCPTEAAKILGMLKPYLDAVCDLPKPVKEDSNNE